MQNVPQVKLSLWRADAVVLFDWLMETDEDTVPVSHRAQVQALRDLLTQLEVQTDVAHSTSEEVEAAKVEVARDMGA
ncbi:MAG TPA: hypothetical protein VF557_14385 [Jatrophihabitans sp.]|jgi:hypothetical protein|uniref:hypothetical protein n=1 Tax=Jatrophihabitans sp. TaxID=1932789 RepID=UPI002EF60D89